jgi:hypothetical protein
MGGSFELSATDLVGYLNCRHLSDLDRAVAEGRLAKPKVFDPMLEILWERGAAHEQNYLEHLTQAGLDVVKIDGVGVAESAVSETFAAMKKGTAVIAQGALCVCVGRKCGRHLRSERLSPGDAAVARPSFGCAVRGIGPRAVIVKDRYGKDFLHEDLLQPELHSRRSLL